MKITAKVEPLDGGKYYGTYVQMYNEEGRKVGNPFKFWYFADWIGGHQPSDRETDPEAGRHDDHYENVGDLTVARLVAERLTGLELPELSDEDL